MKKILLIRLDKIGDLVSTLPADQTGFMQNHDITWVISKGLGFIPENAEPRRKFIELDKGDRKNSYRQLLDYLQKEKPDMAVSFQAPWWVSMALWKAGVKVRAGVRSQWHSFLFLNKSLRQKRSEARQHEADYNADLLAYAADELEKRLLDLNSVHGSYKSPLLKLKDPGQLDLSKWGLEKEKYIVVHPGMAGSALNWSQEKYVELIRNLTTDYRVVVTGTPADEKWLTEIKKQYSDHPQVLILQNQLNAVELISLLAKAHAVVAPSTGVAHIAAALEKPIIGIYSPVRVQHPRRWGTRGPHSTNLVPNVKCPADFKCLGERCPHFYCIDRIQVEDVLQKIREV